MTKYKALKQFQARLLFLLEVKKTPYTELPELVTKQLKQCEWLGATRMETDKAALEAFEMFFSRGHAK